MSAAIRGPAAQPCRSCPYRRDVPSGVWTADEYAKLPLYDRPTQEQPTAVFLCHRADGRVCAGWAGCHDGANLLALRLAPHLSGMTPDDVAATVGYRSPVPLWPSGTAAAAHGLAEVDNPGPAARSLGAQIIRKRARTPMPTA